MAIRFFELPRYDLTVLEQDPSSGLISEQTTGWVDFYKEGATVRIGGTINDAASGSISVFDSGAIGVGDFIFKNTVTTQIVEVTAIGFGFITITNNSGTPFVFDAFDRLIASTNRPTMYPDERGRGVGFQQLGLAAGGVAAYGFNFDGILYDSGGTAIRVLKEQTPIGGEDEVDIRKFGAACDNTTDDTDAILAAIDYVQKQATQYGPRVLRFHGAPQVSGKLTISGTGIILRGDGQTATYLEQDAAATLLEISGPDVVVEDMSLQFSPGAGVADRPLDLINTAENFRGRRLRLVTPGLGIAIRNDGAVFDDVLVNSGDGFSRLFTVIGSATQSLGASISRLRARVTATGSEFGIIVENGAKHFRLRDSVLAVVDPATQGMVCMQFQLGGGNAPEDCIVSDSFISSGTSTANVFNAGNGIQYSRVLVADSRIGHRTATVSGKEVQEVTWANCGCVGIGESSWVFDDASAVKRMQSCWSSDVSQDAGGMHPHVSINANGVFIDDFAFGNHVRLSATEAAHGVKYEPTGTHGAGHVHGVININTATNNGLVPGGNAIHAPDANAGESVDISHNSHPRNQGTATLFQIIDHPGVAHRKQVESTGTTLAVGGYGVIELTGVGRTYDTFTTGAGNDGHELLIINRTANTFTLNHVGGTWVNKGGTPKSLLTFEAIRYLRVGDAYIQISDPFAIA